MSRNRCWWLVAVAIAILAAVLSCGDRDPRPLARGEAPWPSPAVSAPPVVAPAPTPTPTVEPVGFLSGEGSSLVPEQIEPGTYQSPGPSGKWACYAFVLDDKGRVMDPAVMRGQTTVVVPAGAGSVKAQHCQPFVRVR